MHSTLDVMYTSMRNSVGGVRNGYFVLAACLATALVTVAHADDSDAIVGLWVTADKDGYVEITRTGDVYDGTIVGGADETERFDERNPDPQMRDRPLLGLKIMQGFAYDDHQWTGGRIYDPNNGKTYKCKLELKDDGTLRVRGYVGIPLFGWTEVWTRSDDARQPGSLPRGSSTR